MHRAGTVKADVGSVAEESVRASSSCRLVVVLASSHSIACVWVCAVCVARIAASRSGGEESVVRASASTVAGVLDDALGSRVTAGKTRGFVIILAAARTVASVRIGTFGVASVSACCAGREESIVCTCTRTVAGVLDDALGSRVTAGETGGFVVVLASARTIACVGIGTFGVASVSACCAGREESIVCTRTRAVTGVLHDARCSSVTAGETGRFVVVLASARTIACVGIGTFGVASVSAGRTCADEAVVCARARAIARVLDDAFGSGITAGEPRGFVIVLAGARPVASIGVGTFSVASVSAGRTCADEAVVCARARAIAGVLDHAFGSGITAGDPGGFVVVLAGARPVAGVRIRTLGIARAATRGSGADEPVVGARTTTVASVLYDALGSGVTAGEAGGFVVVKASARTVACVGVRTLGIAAIATGAAG